MTVSPGRHPVDRWSTYHFRSSWSVRAARDVVFDALADLRSYPAWWPQVRKVEDAEDADGGPATVVVRSLLPYSLRVVTTATRQDRAAGVLEARLSGDMEGWSRWTLPAPGEIGPIQYEQVVTVRRALLRRLEPVARPFFRFNHALMMRAGQRGLQRHLDRR